MIYFSCIYDLIKLTIISYYSCPYESAVLRCASSILTTLIKEDLFKVNNREKVDRISNSNR